MKNKKEKQQDLDQLRAQLEANKNIFLAGYEKMKVDQDFELRKTVRGAGGTYKVIKNRIAEKAARGRAGLFVALALAWPATGLFLKTCTNTDVPWWDAFPTAASVIGQWLLGRKYVENWLAWIVVNTVSVGLFAYKGLWLTTLLYGLFIAMSVIGWRAWRRLTTPAAA